MKIAARLPVLLLASLLLAAGARAESEPTLAAEQLVAPELLSGPGWRVQRRVEVRGYQARFRIRSQWGEMEADSVELLAIRVAEMPALAALHRNSVSESLIDAGGERFLEPASAVGNVVRHPVRTVVGLPRGVARYFGERWQRLRDGARRLADQGREAITQDGSPYEAPDGPMGEAGPTQREPRPGWWKRRGREVVGLVKNEASYPQTRRQLAERLGIDPYTSNPLIIPRLDGLAWAETGGRLATGKAIALLAGPAAGALAYAVTLDRVVLRDAPEQVRERNRLLLEGHCQDAALLRAFLVHGVFTPSLQTELTDLYLQLAPAQGCEALLETALMADTEPQARFVINGLRLLAHHLGEESRGGRVIPQGALLAYETPGGEFVLPLAVDWLSWTPQLRRWFDLPVIGHRPARTLVTSGGISPRSQRELTERGWSLVPRLPYPGAPPYRRAPGLALP